MVDPIELPIGAKLDTYHEGEHPCLTYTMPDGMVTVYGARLKDPPPCVFQQPRERSVRCHTCLRPTIRRDAYCHQHSPTEGEGMDRALAGRRVELISTSDPYTHLTPGSVGVVQFRDDVGTLHVRWDDGSSLGLVDDEDRWKLLPEQPAAAQPE